VMVQKEQNCFRHPRHSVWQSGQVGRSQQAQAPGAFGVVVVAVAVAIPMETSPLLLLLLEGCLLLLLLLFLRRGAK